MKKIFRRFLVVSCILMMAVGLTACGGEKEVVNYDQAEVTQIAEYLTTSLITQMDTDTLAKIKEAYEPEEISEQLKSAGIAVDGEGFLSGIESWNKAAEELGGLAQVAGTAITADDETVTAIVSVIGNSGKTAQMEYIFNSRLKMTSCTTNIDRTFGENMTNAGLNTLLGMGTVFVVLIFISFIISMFKYVNILDKKMKAKKEAPKQSAAAVDKAVAQIIETEEQTDDLELIAVISAAIAAFEESQGNTGDGYVVRSIKKRY